MHLSAKRVFVKQQGKRLLSFLMVLIITIGCLGTLGPTSTAATATQTNPVVFKVRGAIDSSVSNGVKYSITVSEVYTTSTGYQSFTISYPDELTINYDATSTFANWTITDSNGSCSFILKDGSTEPYADGLKDLIESIYFTLTTADKYPEEGATVGIDANERRITAFTDEDGYLHYYEFYGFETQASNYPDEDNPDGTFQTWLKSYNLAKKKTYTDPYTGKELTGYLATITSEEEQKLIFDSIATHCGWLGGTRMVSGTSEYNKIQDEDSISEDISDFEYLSKNLNGTGKAEEWYWACGPEATMGTDGSPLVFWSQPKYSSSDPTGKTDVYSAFNNPLCDSIKTDPPTAGTSSEPNDSYSSDGEFCLQFAYNNSDLWNDYYYDYSSEMLGYYVEYGGYEGDPTVEDIEKSTSGTATVELVMQVNVQYRSTVQNSNGEYSTSLASDTTVVGAIGEKYTVKPLASAPTGYTFSGYAFSGNDTDKTRLTADSSGNVSGYYSTRQQTIIFLYKPDSLTVTFNKNGGDSVSIASKTVTYDQEYGTLATATRAGYNFDGWYADSNVTGSEVTNTTTVITDTDHTLYAKWSEKSSFTVKYNLNGGLIGDSTAVDDLSGVLWTQSVLLPNTPTLNGYSFIGWNVSVGGSKQGVTASDTYGELADSDADGSSITLQAQWLENSSDYTVIYRVNGADSPTFIANEVLASASDMIPTPTVTRMGYTFGGWQVIDDGTGNVGSAGSIVGSSDSFDTHSSGSYLILEAQWSLDNENYIVTYKNNYSGASENYAQVTNVLLTSTDLVTAAGGTPTRDGYTFIGWNVKENGSGAYVTDSNRYGDLYAITGDNDELILYAQWQENVKDNMVYYDLNGSASAQPDSIMVALTDNNLLPTSDPDAPTGYTFRGWDVSYNGNKMNVTVSDSFQDLAADTSIHYIVLQAQWTPISTYELVFNANGGTGYETLNDIGWTDISLPDLISSNPTRSGYTFTGWNTAANGSGKTVLDTDSYGDLYTIAGSSGDSLTLYAQWVASEYRVKYDVNGATNPTYLEEKTLTDTTATVDFPSVAREGYTFDGWLVTENGKQTLTGNCTGDEKYEDLAATLNATDYVPYIILQAQWTPTSTYELVFDANGGTGDDTLSNISWTDISLPDLISSNPTRSGYTFMGWNTASDGSGKTVLDSDSYGDLYAIAGSGNSLTLYAQWNETPVQYYTVHYDINCAGMENPPSKTRVKAGDSNLLPDTSGSSYERDGYEISAWNVIYGGSGTDVQAVDTYGNLATAGAYSITLQAQWEMKSYDVKYDLNGGKINGSDTIGDIQGVTWTTNGLLPDTEPTRSGYTFTGWNVSVNGSKSGVESTDTYGDLADSSSATYITLQAQWRSNGSSGGITNPSGSDNNSLDTLLNSDDHIRYIYGYSDGSIKADGNITRAEAAVIFYRLLNEQGVVTSNYFSDVPDNAWYVTEVNYLASVGILRGYGDGTFRPNNYITRAEFAALAARFDELSVSSTNVFSDVSTNHWAFGYINSAYAKGWISGYPDGTFRAGNNITRAEVVSIINSMLDRKISAETLAKVKNPYNDITAAHWAYADIIEASYEHDYIRLADNTEKWS